VSLYFSFLYLRDIAGELNHRNIVAHVAEATQASAAFDASKENAPFEGSDAQKLPPTNTDDSFDDDEFDDLEADFPTESGFDDNVVHDVPKTTSASGFSVHKVIVKFCTS
jgi:hypothetical protein